MKNFKLLSGILVLLALTGCTSTKTYENQEKINQLTQNGMVFYWHGGDLKKAEKEFFKGITLKGKYDVVENSFKEASQLDPNRLDLRFGIASSQILQNKTEEALATYKDILKIYPSCFEASMLLAGYNKALGNEDEFNSIITNSMKIHPEKTANFIERFNRTEDTLNIKFETKAYKVTDPNTVIITLGYALGKGGVMEKPLIGRLEQTLAIAKLNPELPIIVTGGVPQGGVTEGFVMKNWLVKKGIAPERIYIEDQAKDTVGNALYSTKILKTLNAENVVLISSATHMRRATAVLKEMSETEGLKLNKINNLVYFDYNSLEEAYNIPQKEKLVIYRDMMRASGMWAYPGIQM